MFYYEDRGHRFCVIRFAARPAWVYDASMGLWHERGHGAELDPWPVVGAVNVYDGWHLATQDGAFYQIGTDPYDADAPLRRMAIARPVYADGARFSVHDLEIIGRFGRFNAHGAAPQMWIRTSNDGGNTFSVPKVRTLGMQGNYDARAVWRNLGQFRNFTCEVNMTDPVDVPILSEGNIRAS